MLLKRVSDINSVKMEHKVGPFPKAEVALSLLLLSGCTSSHNTAPVTGYGDAPANPESVIAKATASQNVAVIGKPTPFYMRANDIWHYGWRTCANLDNGEKQGFFLLRGDDLLYKAVADTKNASQSDIASVRQYCPILLDQLAAPAPAMNQSRIGLKN